MPSKKKVETFKRIAVTFTQKQIELIDQLVESGELGGSRAEVIKQIIMFYLKDNDKKSIFP